MAGCRRHSLTGCYVAPSESTIRRVAHEIDADAADLTNNRLHGISTQPAASIPDRRRCRHRPSWDTPTKRLRENLRRRPIRRLRKQTQTENQIKHQPRRRLANTLFPNPELINHPINELNRERPRQHTHRSLVRQARTTPRHQDPQTAGCQPRFTQSKWHCAWTRQRGHHRESGHVGRGRGPARRPRPTCPRSPARRPR